MKPASRSGARFGHRYPWDDWLTAPLPLVLRRGADFPADVLPSSLAVMLRVQAGRRGVRRTVRVLEDRVEVSDKNDFRGAKPKDGR